ncbi:Cj0814 family flagellar-dependent secreted protein, partial [Campylobacter coli]|uniref:Cj0814 family flagellar-dependent secreted protein n=4 Tax=Campylobacter coli TaxID=195 RepID=UPI003F7BEF52
MINTAYINNHHKGGYSTQKLKDISQATTQSLGISKNYKIDATQMQTLVKNLSQNKHFDTIDFTKTLENAYKVFSNLMQFSKNELPLGFEMDKNSFEILKIYDKAQDLENNFLNENNSYKGSKVVINLKDLNSKDKSFMNFANVVFNQFGGGYLIEGQSNISGKLMGFDKNMDKNQIQDLNDFIKNNSFIANGSMEKLMEALDLFSSNLSIEEFKQKWLNLTINLEPSNKTIEQIVREDLKAKEEQKPRTPIQSESQNKETYKDDSKMNELVKKLLENKFGTSDELELLFGMKFSDDDAGEFNKFLSSNSAPKSIDI